MDEIGRHRADLVASGRFSARLAERSERVMIGELGTAAAGRILERAMADPGAAG